MIRWEMRPEEDIPGDAIFVPTKIVGKYTRTELTEGQLILSADVVAFIGQYPESDYRVASVKVQMPAEMVKPGDFVDIVAVDQETSEVSIILTHVEVWHLDESTANDGSRVIRVLFHPSDIEPLAHALEHASSLMVLLNPPAD